MLTTTAGRLFTAISNPLGTNGPITTSPFDASPSLYTPTEWNERLNELEKVVNESITAVPGDASTKDSIEVRKADAITTIDDLPLGLPMAIDYTDLGFVSEAFMRIKKFHDTLSRVIYRKYDSSSSFSSEIPKEFKELEKFLYEPSEELLTTKNYEMMILDAMQKFREVAQSSGKEFIPPQFMHVMMGEHILLNALKILAEASRLAEEDNEDSIKFNIRSHLVKKVIWQRILSGQKELLRELNHFIHAPQRTHENPYTRRRLSQLWLNARTITDIQQMRDEIFTLMNCREKILHQYPNPDFDYAYVTDITPKSNRYAESSHAAFAPERLNEVIQEILKQTFAGTIPAASQNVFLDGRTWTVESFKDSTYPNCYLYTDTQTNEKFRLRRIDRSDDDRSILLAGLNLKFLTRIYKIYHSVCGIRVPTTIPKAPASISEDVAGDVASGMIRRLGESAITRRDHIWLVEEYLPYSPEDMEDSKESVGPIALGGILGCLEINSYAMSKWTLMVDELRGRDGKARPVFKIDDLKNIILYPDYSPYRGYYNPDFDITRALNIFSEDLVGLYPDAIPQKVAIGAGEYKEVAHFFNTTLDAQVEELSANLDQPMNPPGPVIARSDLSEEIQVSSNYRPAEVYGNEEDHYWPNLDDELESKAAATGRPGNLTDIGALPDHGYAFSSAPSTRTGLINQCIDFLSQLLGNVPTLRAISP